MKEQWEKVMLDERFQAACQRYAHENGSSEAIARAVIAALNDARVERVQDAGVESRRAVLLVLLNDASRLLADFPPGEMRDIRRRIDHESAMLEALPACASNEHVPSDDPFAALKKFYAVTTDAELIAIQEQRIEKLLARLPPMRDTQPGRVREG